MEPFPPFGSEAHETDAQPKKPGLLRRWGKRILIGFLGLLILQVVAAGIAGAILANQGRITETVLEGEGEDKLAVISISGALLRGEGGGDPLSPGDPVTQATALLRRAGEDESVKGILLAIDSPGGGLTESDELYHEVDRVAATGRKVLVHMGTLAASGGYYVACAADEIWAQPTTITGSIGVIATFPEVSKLAFNLGVNVEVVKSGPMKDMGSFMKPLGVEERRAFTVLVDEGYERFVGKVWECRRNLVFSDGRANTREYWKGLADGRIYTANQALENGLVDVLGYREEAVARLKEMTGLKNPLVVEYHPPRKGLLDLLGASASAQARDPADLTRWASLLSPRILALWTGR